MGIVIWLYAFFAQYQEGVPYKPDDDFELRTEYAFRQKIVKTPEYSATRDASYRGTGPLPYLSLSLKVLRLNAEEVRIRIVDNQDKHVLSRKLREGMTIDFDAGFTDDMKDRVKAHEYTVQFLSQDKKRTLSKIVIHVGEDGTFLVNNQKRGRL